MRSLATVAVAAGLVAPAAAAGAPPSERVLYEDGYAGRYLLDGPWLRRLDPGERGLGEGWQSQQGSEGWTPVQVPDAWNATRLTDASQEGGVAWYRRDFELPAVPAPGGWRIRFESVNLRARVYLNGERVGQHTGAHLPFEVPGRGLRAEGPNRLVVRVDNRRLPTDLPPFETSASGQPGGGWWNDGGLLREVYLRRVGRYDVRDVRVRARPGGEVSVAAELVNATGEPLRVRPAGSVGSEPLPFGEVSIPAGGAAVATARVRVGGPRPWSPRDPHLYPVAIADGATPLYRLKAGLREWRVRGGLLYLNGRRRRLFGASLHEDQPGAGFAQSAAQRRADVGALVRLGATVTRAHYPLHPATMELLDRRGIALWSQVPAYRYSDAALADPGVRRRALDYLAAMVERDRNHAALLAVSSGNELPSRPKPRTRRYIAAAADLTRRLAPGALAALDISAYPTVGKKAVYERSLQALGINEYFGWYRGPRLITADRSRLGPYLDRSRRDYPGLALFVTELGAEASRDGPAAEKGTYAFQSDFLRYHLGQIARRDFVNGALVWLLRDFRARPAFTGGNPRPNPPFNQKGLLAYGGAPKPAFTTVRAAIRRAKQTGG